MLRGLFVTGTDTGVGKTVVSAALMHRLRDAAALRYWKPVQTGIEVDDDTSTVGQLASLGPDRILNTGVRLPRPLSPHLSAALAGQPVSIAGIREFVVHEPDTARWIVEGAGGVLVPLNDRETMADLIFMLGLPAVVAARSGLGTINHTLLTIEALRMRAVPVAGVIMVGPPNVDNRIAIESWGHVPVVGEIPLLDPLTPDRLQRAAAALDRGADLRRYFE